MVRLTARTEAEHKQKYDRLMQGDRSSGRNKVQFSSPVAEVVSESNTESKAEVPEKKMDTNGEYYADYDYEDPNSKEFSKGFNRPWAKLKKRVFDNGKETFTWDFERNTKKSFEENKKDSRHKWVLFLTENLKSFDFR